MHFKRPLPEQVPDFYKGYIERLPDGDLIPLLELGKRRMMAMLRELIPAQVEYSYAEGKWTLGQVIRHVIDAERVFLYRAFTMGRFDDSDLPAFDQNKWAESSKHNMEAMRISELYHEYLLVRNLTLHTFKKMTREELFFQGKVNGWKTCANDLAFIIAGHEDHHLNVIGERYLDF
ncbi:DinB family protein [Schleiferia thermophila]|uniref:DinB family protein n=1 Tax=Schleiferia thermophila TaxID=884107 RepID=UPI002FDB3B8E